VSGLKDDIHPLDLQKRAAMAARSLTRLLDECQNGLLYFLASWRAKPPRAFHGLWDYGDGSGRHTDALTLARRMLPAEWKESEPDQGEQQIEGWMMRQLGAEGISWLPNEPHAAVPWGAELMLRDWRIGEAAAEISWAQRGTLLGLTTRFLATRDEKYSTAGRRMVDGLMRIAERDGQELYFPEGYFRSGGWRTQERQICSGIAEYNAAVIVPAVRFFRAAGYQPALDLAEGLARFALRHSDGYCPDGSLYCPQPGSLADHFHTRSNFILGVLELGLVTGRREYLAWARQSYERAREFGSSAGWFPEGLGHRHGEVCCMTDMLEIALNLGLHIDPLYLADAERFGRNHLLESQFLSLERLSAAVNRLPEETVEIDESMSTTTGVTESQVGGFAARSTLNDAFHLDATAMMQCCNAAGTRGLYDLWRYAITCEQGHPDESPRIQVNLRLSVENEALRVVSHEPKEGRLDITPAQDALVAVCIPQGECKALLTRPDGSRTTVEVAHGYAVFDVGRGQSVQMTYPLVERESIFRVGPPDKSMECGGRWRGETLLSIEPPGEYLPLYQGRSAQLEPVFPLRPGKNPIDSLVSIF
jgi:hypothetical protein